MTAVPYPAVDNRAPCRSGSPDRFFPGPGVSRKTVEKVMAECRECPFRAPCGSYALVHNVEGIWGGTTIMERQKHRQEHGIDALPITGLHIRDRRGTARQMRSRGIPVGRIADTLGITDQAVRQLLDRAS